jgi:FtsH-binding integral membrane protein
MAAMDEPDPPDDEDEVAASPPGAFGLSAHPLGCGLLGGALFALTIAPVVLAYAAPNRCFDPGGTTCPWPPEGTGLGLALAAWAGAAFGLATAGMVARRLALWRAGARVRPALWVAFVALFALAWGPGSVALSLLLGLIGAVAGQGPS